MFPSILQLEENVASHKIVPDVSFITIDYLAVHLLTTGWETEHKNSLPEPI